eukprot:scaffold7734_cov592-Prasinococcus_capsulatus_cf.AAC.10
MGKGRCWGVFACAYLALDGGGALGLAQVALLQGSVELPVLQQAMLQHPGLRHLTRRPLPAKGGVEDIERFGLHTAPPRWSLHNATSWLGDRSLYLQGRIEFVLLTLFPMSRALLLDRFGFRGRLLGLVLPSGGLPPTRWQR